MALDTVRFPKPNSQEQPFRKDSLSAMAQVLLCGLSDGGFQTPEAGPFGLRWPRRDWTPYREVGVAIHVRTLFFRISQAIAPISPSGPPTKVKGPIPEQGRAIAFYSGVFGVSRCRGFRHFMRILMTFLGKVHSNPS